MQNYELLFILPGTLGEDEVKPLVEKVKEVVEANGGKEYSVEDMGKSRLAYPIKHIRYGYFQLAHFQAETKDAVAVEKKLRLNTSLLRALIQKYDPSKKMQKITFADQQVPEQPVFVGMPAPAAVVVENLTEEKEASLNIQSHSMAPKVEKKTKKSSTKVSLDDIDKKLDEILEIDIDKV